jgi:predicted transcriptional regulator
MRHQRDLFDYIDLQRCSPQRTRAAVEKLRNKNSDLCQVFIGRHFDMLSQSEIGRLLGISQGTVSKRLRRANGFMLQELFGVTFRDPSRVNTLGAIAKELNLSRRELVRELAAQVTYTELAEARGDDPNAVWLVHQLAQLLSRRTLESLFEQAKSGDL